MADSGESSATLVALAEGHALVARKEGEEGRVDSGLRGNAGSMAPTPGRVSRAPARVAPRGPRPGPGLC
ncbi:hypothetical protein HPB47_001854 [Ixodes persulcatus]|uniref:Uncharacterized protein n=1 Tax=Ixodes persulcatus TaxID=34615 RepID=A0AC60PN12_IXOPE|nr:hypothetical protein HPB47_001854 [Ixodes persulcatus]